MTYDRSMLVLPVIRLAHVDDAVAIADMSRRDIEHGLGWSWTEARVRQSIRDAATNVAVMTDAERVIGFGIMQYRDETAHLSLFAISPIHRHRGLGSALLAWLEKPALVAGVQRLRVEARADNLQALAFYERRGFRRFKTVPGYYNGMVDAVRLQKQLVQGG